MDQHEELRLGDVTLILKWKKASGFTILAGTKIPRKQELLAAFDVSNPQVLQFVQRAFPSQASPFSRLLFSCFLMDWSQNTCLDLSLFHLPDTNVVFPANLTGLKVCVLSYMKTSIFKNVSVRLLSLFSAFTKNLTVILLNSIVLEGFLRAQQ